MTKMTPDALDFNRFIMLFIADDDSSYFGGKRIQIPRK